MSNSAPSTKPYLLRAIYEWAEDNGFTPQVLVNAENDGVIVPDSHVVDGQIVLNISGSAIELYSMDNENLHFSARFSGKAQEIYLPMDSILAIFARENSQGIFFEDHQPESDPDPEGDNKSKKKESSVTSIERNKGQKRGSSHLKIIK